MADADSRKAEIEAAIRDSMSSALQGIAREMAAVNNRARDMASSGSGFGSLDKFLTSMTDKLISPAGMVGALVATGKALDNFAVGQLQLQNFARDTGLAAGQVQEYRQQLGLLGVPADQANVALRKLGGNLQSAMAVPWANNFVSQIMKTNAPLAVRIQTLVNAGQQGKVGKEIYDEYVKSNEAGKAALSLAADMSHTEILALGQDTTGLIKEWEQVPGASLEYHKGIINLTQTQSNIWKSIQSNAISGIVSMSDGWEGMDKAARKVANFINVQVNMAFFDFTAIIKDTKAFIVWLDGRAEAKTTDTLADIGEAGYKGLKKSGLIPRRARDVDELEIDEAQRSQLGTTKIGDNQLLGGSQKRNQTLEEINDILKKMWEKGKALPQKRQEGGAVLEDQPYEVGEAGPEMFAGGGGYSLVGEGGPEVIRPKQTGRIVSEIEAMGREYQPKSPVSQMVGTAMGLYGIPYAAGQFLKGHAGAGDELKSQARKLFGIEDPGEPAPWASGGEWGRGPSGAASLGSREQDTPAWRAGSLSSREEDTPAWMKAEPMGSLGSREQDTPAWQKAAPDQTGLARQYAALAAIGGSETDFSRKEAYSDRYNTAKTNANVRRYGQRGADYGYYQMNQMDVDDAVRRGMSPDLAKHLHGGGRRGTSTLEEQTLAAHEYMKLKYSKQYERLAESGDFEEMRRAAGKQFFGLTRDKGNISRQYYEKANERLTESLKGMNGKPKLNADITFKNTPPGVTTFVRGSGIDTLKSTNEKQLARDFAPEESGMGYGY